MADPRVKNITEKDKPCNHVPVAVRSDYSTWYMYEDVCMLCGKHLGNQKIYQLSDVRDPNQDSSD